MNSKYFRLIYLLETVIHICELGINANADAYIDPAKSYFVTINPLKTDYGIELEIQSNRRVHFKDNDFFKIFPRIILGKSPGDLDIARSAAQFNQNNKKRSDFVPVEVWWLVDKIEFSRVHEINHIVEAISNVNIVYTGTISTLYLIPQQHNQTVTAEAVGDTLINATGTSSLSLALEIKGHELACDEIKQLLLNSSLQILSVWLRDVQNNVSVEESLTNLISCHKELGNIKNDKTKPQIILKGIIPTDPSKLADFSIDYRNGSLKVKCDSDNTLNKNPLCKYLGFINSFANDSPASFAIYNFIPGNSLGIAEHPNRVSCGIQDDERNSWLRPPLKLSNGVGFSVYFDSKHVKFTRAKLLEVITSSRIIVIENLYELAEETSTVQLNDFLGAYANVYNKFKVNTNEQRHIKIKLNMQPIETRSQFYISKWTTIAVEAANKANQLSPELVEGVVCRLDKDNKEKAADILKTFNDIKGLQGHTGLKFGVSFPSHVDGCPYFFTEYDSVDFLFFEYDIRLSIQCFGKSRSKFFEEKSEAYSVLLRCQSVLVVSAPSSLATLQYGALIRFTKCKPSWQSVEEIDVQYSLGVERFNEIAGVYGLQAYIGSAFEEDASSEDSCGWWQVQENVTANGEEIIQNRKASLRQKWYRDPEVKPSTSLLWLWISLPFILLCIVVVIISGVVIYKYQRKYVLWYDEVSAFFKGDTTIDTDETMGTGNADALTSRYNKEKYEIPAHQHSIDESKCLGSGEFGSVYHGTVTKENKVVNVAIKVTKQRAIISQNGNLVALRGLISEIKILSRVGEHENIVRLIGAYTDKLKQGYVAVFLELCSKGSLFQHLRECKLRLRENSGNFYENRLMQNHNQLESELLCNLMRWSYEIANGMEFLSRKHIVHADLATRNVLLDSSFVAKIADFGLSRRMYNYTNYVKTHQEPLPWRWMAPEALQSLQFDEKTDVWAYGVTLWEIFTLGDVPYPGLAWSADFANQLNNGLRLAEPKHNHQEMYNLMLNCWDNNPEERPTFTDIMKRFQEKLNSSNTSTNSTDYVNLI